MVRLKRTLGLFDTVSLAIGAIVGAGIFIITGVSSEIAGPALIISILLGGLITAFTAISVIQLVQAFPKEGGEYEYGYKTISPLAGFMSGWIWGLNKIVAGAVLALGFTTYFSIYFPFLPFHLVAISLIAVVTLINYLGVRTTGTVIDLFVVAKLSILLFFVVLGSLYFKSSNFYPFATHGINGILQAAGVMFFAYVGFARPIYLVEEIKNPKKNVVRGIIIALAISIVFYFLVTFVAIGLVGTNVLGHTDSPLASAIASTGLSWTPNIITLGALLAIFSVLLDDNLGLSRMIFAMGRRGDYPKFFGNVEKKSRVPRRAIIFTGMITAILTLFFDLRNIVQVASFFILIYFALVNLSALKLQKRLRRFPVTISLLGIIGTLGLAFSLSLRSVAIGFILILVGIIYFYFRKKF